MKTKKLFKQNGFTLIEILLAMMITTILAAGINASYHQILNVYDSIEQQREIYHKAIGLTSTLRAELSGLYLPVLANSESNQDVFTLSAVKNNLELTFFTLTPAWNHVPANDQMAKITYSFQKTDEAAQLIRKEQLYSSEKAISSESSQVIDEKLVEFSIQVAGIFETNIDSWQQNFSSKSSAPKAAKIKLGYLNEKKGTCIKFNMTVLIRCEN